FLADDEPAGRLEAGQVGERLRYRTGQGLRQRVEREEAGAGGLVRLGTQPALPRVDPERGDVQLVRVAVHVGVGVPRAGVESERGQPGRAEAGLLEDLAGGRLGDR